MKSLGLIGSCLLLAACNVWRPVLQDGFCLTAADCEAGLACVANRCAVSPVADAGDDATVGGDGGGGMISDGGGPDAAGSCLTSAQCGGDKPICENGNCVACSSADQCAASHADRSLCAPTGACVSCLAASDCGEGAPICSASNTCVACNAEGVEASACGQRDSSKPACAMDTGRCVECTGNNECASVGKPICAANACRRCEADAECVAKVGADPGVCMKHDDGRCATLGETVFVERVNGKCMNTPQAGTVAVPFCGLQQGIDAAKGGGKPLIVLGGPTAVVGANYSGPGKISVVGKAGALIRGGAEPGLAVEGGEAFLRGMTIEASIPGVQVTNGARLQAEDMTIVNNPGGGVLVESGELVLRNTMVSRNGPTSTTGGVFWGGMRLEGVTSTSSLEKVSVVNNESAGVSCAVPIQANGVLVSGNPGGEVSTTCNFMSCGMAGPACGAP